MAWICETDWIVTMLLTARSCFGIPTDVMLLLAKRSTWVRDSASMSHPQVQAQNPIPEIPIRFPDRRPDLPFLLLLRPSWRASSARTFRWAIRHCSTLR
ncbi:MAG: hypothetical protein ABJB12_24195 [Pseudomonadota bacterium]